MTGKDDAIPEDVRKAFEQAAKALYAWDSIGGDEPTVIVDGSPMPISMVATLAGTYKDMMPTGLYWRMVHQLLAQTQSAGVEVEPRQFVCDRSKMSAGMGARQGSRVQSLHANA